MDAGLHAPQCDILLHHFTFPPTSHLPHQLCSVHSPSHTSPSADLTSILKSMARLWVNWGCQYLLVSLTHHHHLVPLGGHYCQQQFSEILWQFCKHHTLSPPPMPIPVQTTGPIELLSIKKWSLPQQTSLILKKGASELAIDIVKANDNVFSNPNSKLRPLKGQSSMKHLLSITQDSMEDVSTLTIPLTRFLTVH